MVHLLLIIIYLSFISLGLPDSLLGSAWPTLYTDISVPISYAGIISMIISVGTISSSLLSDRLTRRFGPGRITAISVLTTAIALYGFSTGDSFLALCLWAIPYGLGAGAVDAALNNYVALHYASRHMSWLHCMWGLGASIGPYIMGYALTGGQGWNMGYRYVAFIQMSLSFILFVTLPIWRKKQLPHSSSELADREHDAPVPADSATSAPLSLLQIFKIPGAKEVIIAFFCYCALEQTAGLWASSYLALHLDISGEIAAEYASLFYIGITLGRAVSGFLTMKYTDKQMTRLGQLLILVGVILLLLPLGQTAALISLIVIGLGCAPIYPCIIHSTPAIFGAEKSQAMIGVQMAAAYMGSLAMPPLFGVLAREIGVYLLPFYLGAILLLMLYMHEKLHRVTAK